MSEQNRKPAHGSGSPTQSAADAPQAEFPAQPLMFSDLSKLRKAGERSRTKLLCVVAHPDDECFAFGGALALAAEAGVETSVICFTDGQAASNRGTAASGEELGAMRRAEFAASCKILGVAHHELLDYHDGQLEFASFAEAAGKLVERIRSFKPQVVLTFGGDGGMNTHTDHTMVSAFTTAAFHWAGRTKRFPDLGSKIASRTHIAQRLYYVTTGFFFPDRPAPAPMPWTVTLDIRAVKQRKYDAFKAHLSQSALLEKFQFFFDTQGGIEHYALAAAPEPQPARQTTGLSAGL
jgi:LmbE family N-acetylglucosaminyl deacetylase